MSCVAVIDPSCLWLLDGLEQDDAVAIAYIETCIKWIQTSEESNIKAFICNEAISMLAERGFYPATPYFEKILSRPSLLHVVTPRHMASIINVFLSKTPALEDAFAISQVLYEDIVIKPNILQTIGDKALQDVSEVSLMLAAVNFSAVAGKCGMACYAYPRLPTPARPLAIAVDARILGMSPTQLDSMCSNVLSSRIRILTDPEEVWDNRTAEEIWQSATDSKAIKSAIERRAQELAGANSNGVCSEFFVGSEFYSSLVAAQASGTGEYSTLVLQKCAQIVAKTGNLKIGYLYTSKKSKTVRTRELDHARARRMHLTSTKQGLRLMFWEYQDGKVEFSTVENKANVIIRDGDPSSIV